MSKKKEQQEQFSSPAKQFRFWMSWWPVVAFLILTTAVVAWIFYPACPDVRGHRAHLAGMAGFFAWYIPWFIVTVRDAWRNMKPPKVNPALLAALEAAISLPDESEEPEWHDAPEFATETSVLAEAREHESELKTTLLDIDFEIEN